ncbi:MAG: hypothetical protein ACRBFS_04790 [Aureispira sp.]
MRYNRLLSSKTLLIWGYFLYSSLIISCQKVITINIDNNNTVPVIEAHIEKDSLCYVLLTSTVDIFHPEFPPFIENARITISDDQGNQEMLYYQGIGIYRGRHIIGVEGRTYTLSVTINEKEYKVRSHMPSFVAIDNFRLQSDTTFLPSTFYVNNNVYLFYEDPAHIANFYYIKIKQFSSLGNTTTRNFLVDDLTNNGTYVDFPIVYQDLEAGDILSAEFRSINRTLFDYYLSMEDALSFNNLTNAAPANPNPMFSNGALGYFGTWSADRTVFVVR